MYVVTVRITLDTTHVLNGCVQTADSTNNNSWTTS